MQEIEIVTLHKRALKYAKKYCGNYAPQWSEDVAQEAVIDLYYNPGHKLWFSIRDAFYKVTGEQRKRTRRIVFWDSQDIDRTIEYFSDSEDRLINKISFSVTYNNQLTECQQVAVLKKMNNEKLTHSDSNCIFFAKLKMNGIKRRG